MCFKNGCYSITWKILRWMAFSTCIWFECSNGSERQRNFMMSRWTFIFHTCEWKSQRIFLYFSFDLRWSPCYVSTQNVRFTRIAICSRHKALWKNGWNKQRDTSKDWTTSEWSELRVNSRSPYTLLCHSCKSNNFIGIEKSSRLRLCIYEPQMLNNKRNFVISISITMNCVR